MRWHCAVCSNYELCTSCYMNDVHDRNHHFVRFNNPSDSYNGIEVGERSTSFKIQSRGIFPGAKVRTKKDMKCSWTSPVLIGGQVVNLITWDGIPRSTVLVRWGEVGEQILRLGYEGEVDLEVIQFARGPDFYPNHLPMVSVGAHLRLISKIISYDKISSEEITDEAENAINYLDDLLSTCDVQSNAMLCKVKRDIQEMQLAFEKSANIQKPASVSSKQENEKTECPPCEDMKDSQSSSTSDVALENNSFQNDNHSSVCTDTIDGGNVDNARVHHLVRKFSPDGDQQEGPIPENERKEYEVSEARRHVSWIIRKFEKMTSYDMPNFDKKPMERPLYVNNKVPAVSPQNKNVPNKSSTLTSQYEKQATDDMGTTFLEEKPKKENSEFEAKDDISADAKYVNRLVRRFEEIE
ncbi:uncharacterized protein LOC116286331 isoform X2 [Actinia tenebrosa]|nr:uncharacterized protein LOC116286331 isoform X2 [Actinia tenebrosa]XP_031548669.1 uncharacterized protein LOC116286331 isoform X2 [Actinia tenebrosa]